MNALIRWSIRYRGFVALLSVIWLVAGTFLAWRAPLDVFPEFVPPQVTIQTEAPGLAPEQVEQIITRPIESAVIGGPGIATMRSESVYGLSVVLVTFDENADANAARQGIAERLSTLNGQFPAGFGPPRLTPLTSSTMDVLKLGIVSDVVDPYALRDIADWTIKPRLLAVPGIARVTVYGGAVRQIQIQPKLDRLSALGLTVTDVMNAANGAIALRGGGVVETTAQRITIETPPPAPDPRAIAETVVSVQNDRPVKLSDVATVTIAPAVKIGDATIMGQPGVLITVSGQFGANTLEATKATEAALAELAPALRKARHPNVSGAAPPCDLRRARVEQSRKGADARLGADLDRALRLSQKRARGAHLVPCHSAIASCRRRRAEPVRPISQHDDARGLRAGARRSRRRRHHRY